MAYKLGETASEPLYLAQFSWAIFDAQSSIEWSVIATVYTVPLHAWSKKLQELLCTYHNHKKQPTNTTDNLIIMYTYMYMYIHVHNVWAYMTLYKLQQSADCVYIGCWRLVYSYMYNYGTHSEEVVHEFQFEHT